MSKWEPRAASGSTEDILIKVQIQGLIEIEITDNKNSPVWMYGLFLLEVNACSFFIASLALAFGVNCLGR